MTSIKRAGWLSLAISDEEAGKVQPFVAERKISYPVMLDPGRNVNDLYRVEGIPKTFVYDSRWQNGGAIDRHAYQRTVQQMLSQAGLQ